MLALRAGVTIGEAQAQMTAFAKRPGKGNTRRSIRTGPVNIQSMRDALYPETNMPLLVLLAVACANVADLLLGPLHFADARDCGAGRRWGQAAAA